MRKIMVENLVGVEGTQENFEYAMKDDKLFEQAIYRYIDGMEEGENVGVSIYYAGFDGRRQQEFQESMLELYGLEVF